MNLFHRKLLATVLAICLATDSGWANLSSRTSLFSPQRICREMSGTISIQALAGHAFFSGKRDHQRKELETLHDAISAYRSIPTARPVWRRRWLRPILVGFTAITALIQGLTAMEKPSTLNAEQEDPAQTRSVDEKTLFWPSTFDTLPSKDLFSIINWVPDGRLQTQFGAVYEWYKLSHPSVSQKSFYDSVQNGSVKDMRTLLEAYFKASPDGRDRTGTIVNQVLRRTNEILSDPGFQALHMDLLKTFFHTNPPEEPAYETFRIWVEDPLEREALLNSLHSSEFQEFHKYLHSTYGINPNLHLVEVLQTYLLPPQNRKLRQPSVAASFKLIRRYFPGSHLKTIQGITLVDSIPVKNGRDRREHAEVLSQLMSTRQGRKQVETELRRRRHMMDQLIMLYSVSPESLYDYETLLEASDQDLEILLGNDPASIHAPEVYQYFRQHYPGRLQSVERLADLFHFDGFLQKMVQPFQKLGMTPEKVDHFLTMFDLNLGDMNIFNLDMLTLADNGRLREPILSFLEGSPEFREFVKGLLIQYPEVRERMKTSSADTYLAQIIQTYLSASYRELAHAVALYGKSELPELSTHDTDLKASLLESVRRIGGDKLTLPVRYSPSESQSIFSFADRREDLLLIQKNVANGSAASLYQILDKEWDVSEVSLDYFFFVLSRPDELKFFLNVGNAHKFNALREQYHIWGYRSDTQVRTAGLTLGDVTSANRLLENYDLLMKPGVRDLVFRFLPHRLSEINGQHGIWILDLDLYIASHLRVLADPKMALLERALESYGISPVNIGQWIIDRVKEDLKDSDLSELQDMETRRAFTSLQEMDRTSDKGIALDRVSLLDRSIKIRGRVDESLSVLKTLKLLGIEPLLYGNFEYIERYIFNEPKIMANLRNSEFLIFFRQTRTHFYGQENDLEAIPEISDLFNASANRANGADIFSSPSFEHLLTYLRRTFGITRLHPATLTPLMQLAGQFNEKAVDSVIRQLRGRGETVSANDLVLLQRIASDPALMRWVNHRSELEREVESQVYRKPAFFRRSVDQITYLEGTRDTLKTYGVDTQELEQEIQRVKSAYTERPDVKTVPSLLLIRSLLLAQGLQDPAALQQLGDIVSRDYLDKSTEYGGLIDSKGAGISFSEIVSHSEFNGAYQNSKYQFWTGGLLSFHLHALELSSPYEGPSGWLNGLGGDVTFVDYYEATDAVITPLGHPLDATGKEDTSRLRVNVDVYTVARGAKSGAKKAFIIDLGEFIVPITQPLANAPMGKLPLLDRVALPKVPKTNMANAVIGAAASFVPGLLWSVPDGFVPIALHLGDVVEPMILNGISEIFSYAHDWQGKQSVVPPIPFADLKWDGRSFKFLSADSLHPQIRALKQDA